MSMNNPNLPLAQSVERRCNTEGPRFDSWMVDELFVAQHLARFIIKVGISVIETCVLIRYKRYLR